MNLNDYSITMCDISPKATVLLIFEIKRYHPALGSDWMSARAVIGLLWLLMSVIFSVFCLFVCLFVFVQCAGVNKGPAN